MTVSEELVKERIERFERSIKKAELQLQTQELDEESVSRVYSSIGGNIENIGLYKLLLGDVTAATKKFEEATRRYLLEYEHKKNYENEKNGQSYWLTQTSNLERLLYGVLLTRNQELIDEAAEKVRDLDADYNSQFPEGVHRYFHVKALAAVATNAEVQQEYVEEFRKSFTDEDPSHQRYFGAIASVLEGIVQTDEKLVHDGLEVLIDHYDEDANAEPKGLSDRVSKRITALVMLAQQRGMNLDIESRYVPDSILSNAGR